MSFVLRKLNQVKQALHKSLEGYKKQTHQGIKGLSEGTRTQSHRDTQHSVGLAFGFGFFLKTEWTWLSPQRKQREWQERRKWINERKKKSRNKRKKRLCLMYNAGPLPFYPSWFPQGSSSSQAATLSGYQGPNIIKYYLRIVDRDECAAQRTPRKISNG